jgi:8-oxo-dGTP diphosphatase
MASGEKETQGSGRKPSYETAQKAGKLLFAHGSGESKDGPSKNRGAGIIFHIASTDQFLFYLRDDSPDIPYPGMVDIIGGNMEGGETPEETIRREIGEELIDNDTGEPFTPGDLNLFTTFVDEATGEHNIFTADLTDVPNLRLNEEGQYLVFLTREQALETDFAHGLSPVIREYLEND